MTAEWNQDLAVNAGRHGRLGALVGWIASPSYQAVRYFRAAAKWRRRGLVGRVVSMLVYRRAVRLFGCYVSPRASIGPGFRLPHPTGVVVGEGTRIGTSVTLFQNVTIGRKDNAVDAYPVICDDVTVYAGAVILGDVTLGVGCVVGANAVVTRNVPAYVVVAGAPAKPIGCRDEKSLVPAAKQMGRLS